jgi:hypothetical protein
MTNHPNRSRGPYTAELTGISWTRGPRAEFATVREARAWALDYGRLADVCHIRDAKGRVVAIHPRDTSGQGDRWFRAEV